MEHILIVTRDVMPGKFLVPVAIGLLEKGCMVRVIAEGQSIKEWERSNVPTTFKDEGEIFDEHAFINEGGIPDVIIVGCSTPIDLERRFALLANSMGIPLIAFPDTWGARARLGKDVYCDTVLTIDTMSAGIDAEPGERPVVVGDPNLIEIEKLALSVPHQMLQFFDDRMNKRRKTMILVGQGAAYTPSLIRVAVESLKLSPEWDVIPKVVHPKKPDMRLVQCWEEAVREIGDNRVLSVNPSWSVDHMAMWADATMSVFSTTLRVAAFAGKLPVSIATSETVAGMERSTGLSVYPLVTIGHAASIIEAVNLNSLSVSDASRYFQSIRFDLYQAIEAIV